jgi:site-specific DNA-methyltransferase (adenine-specific)
MRQPFFKVYAEDAVTWLKSFPTASVDLVITDPPYESLEKHRAHGTTTRLSHSKGSSNDWFKIFPNKHFPKLLRQLYRVLKPNAHLYLFCDQETAFVLRPIAEQVGFKFWKPLIWDKKKIGMGYHYRSRYEFILFFEKGKRRLNDLSIPDIITVPRLKGKVHTEGGRPTWPTEKPVEVSEVLIKQSTQPGEVVVDPFCGSGSVGQAALKNGRSFLGNDICKEARELTRSRLKQLL